MVVSSSNGHTHLLNRLAQRLDQRDERRRIRFGYEDSVFLAPWFGFDGLTYERASKQGPNLFRKVSVANSVSTPWVIWPNSKNVLVYGPLGGFFALP